ncbi:hypothetical protein [Flavobacterium luteum]|uniref:Uncharacterized protein n=1 Tax=Flavobacterium luteum TaxID=2026654 RepID=A0A7J5AL89_9FLAO|nr:hypothetical protein [Flavobacterium luteum]KAB1157749.1 hypothetical protein F6464_01305 [Flavobacterium luteum]
MTKVTAKFTGENKDLEMFLNCGVTDYSSKFLGINNLHIQWNIDEDNQQKAIETCMLLVNTYQMELWNVEFKDFTSN